MTQRELSPAERNALRPVADRWMLDYQLALDDAREKPSFTLDQWIDLAWNKGFLDHLAPRNPDPEVAMARALMKRTPWRSPADPVFYWRMLYALEYFRVSMKHTQTMGPAAHGCMPLFIAMSKLREEALCAFFPKKRHHPQWPWENRVCELLMAKAQQELRNLGATPHDPVFRKRSKGAFRGIPCEIQAICDDGTLWLQATDFGPGNRHRIAMSDFMRELTPDGHGICPSLLDATLFTPPRGRDR